MELSSLFVYRARLTTFRVLLMEISVDLLALVLLYKFYSLYLLFSLSFSSHCDFKSIKVWSSNLNVFLTLFHTDLSFSFVSFSLTLWEINALTLEVIWLDPVSMQETAYYATTRSLFPYP